MKDKAKKYEYKGGRPTVITKDVIAKLEQSLQNGFTIGKSCELAGISYDAYYDRERTDESFSKKMERAKEFALEIARQNVVNAIVRDKDVNTSKWYLEKKAPDEFGNKSNITANVDLKDERLSEGEIQRIRAELAALGGQADDNSETDTPRPLSSS